MGICRALWMTAIWIPQISPEFRFREWTHGEGEREEKREQDRLWWLWLPNPIKKSEEKKSNTSFSSLFHRGKGNKDRNWIKGWKALACMGEIKGRGNEGEARQETGREVGSSGGLPIWRPPERVTDYREWMALHHSLSHCQPNTHTHTDLMSLMLSDM